MNTVFPEYTTPAIPYRHSFVFLCIIQALERFCYYSVRTVFTVFMVKALSFSPDLAMPLYALKRTLESLAIIAGAFIADILASWSNAVAIGLVLQAAGYFLLLLCTVVPADGTSLYSLLLFSVGLVTAGVGLFKPNLTALIALTAPDRAHTEARFSLFYAIVNLGAAASIIAALGATNTTTLSDYLLPFLIPFIGIVTIAVLFLLLRHKYLGDINTGTGKNEALPYLPQRPRIKNMILPALLLTAATTAILFIPYHLVPDIPYGIIVVVLIPVAGLLLPDASAGNRKSIIALTLLMLANCLFWGSYEYSTGFYPIGNITAYYTGAGTMLTILFCIIAAVFYTKQKQKGSLGSPGYKLMTGQAISVVCYMLIAGMLVQGNDNNTPMLLSLTILNALAEALFAPVLLSAGFSIAPKKYPSLSLSYISLGSAIAGTYITLIPSLSTSGQPPEIAGFSAQSSNEYAFICGIAVLLISLLWLPLNKWMKKLRAT